MQEMANKKRNDSLDNVRFILIFLVVFAHFLEICKPFPGSEILYKVIYTFHMPAFIFLFGYYVKFSPRRILFRWVIPYIFFQTVYISFSNYILGNSLAFQYTTPYWILWYMLACVFFQLVLPIFDTDNRIAQIVALCFTFAQALLVGFEKTIGYYMSLSRFFVFLPFFLLGFYCKKNRILEKLEQKPKLELCIACASVFAVSLSVLMVIDMEPKNNLLYGSYAYSKINATVWMRAVVLFMSLFWILFLVIGLKKILNRNLTLITRIGQNTWPVFLLHGFFVKAAPKFYPEILKNWWMPVLITCFILLITGNGLCKKVIDRISFAWLENIGKDR